MAALRGEKSLPRSVTCYHCNQQGHVKRNCPALKNRPLQSRKCFICGRAGHIAKNCLQENFSGVSAQGRSGADIPVASIAPFDVTMVTTTKSKLATCILKGELCGVQVNIMLDSGSSVSLIRQDIARKITPVQVTKQSDSNKITLVTASGAALPILQQVEARVSFDGLESPVSHSFLVVKSLISPVIVGVDFLQQQHLSLDFSYCPVRVHHSSQEAASHNREVAVSSREERRPCFLVSPVQLQVVNNLLQIGNIL